MLTSRGGGNKRYDIAATALKIGGNVPVRGRGDEWNIRIPHGAFVLSSIQSYLVVMAVAPQWFMVLLGVIVVAAAPGDRNLQQWALRK